MKMMMDIEDDDLDLGMQFIDGDQGKSPEPTEDDVREYMEENNENFYNARERLRERVYGGKPPNGYQSWGDYWKSY
jgi:hypothetical protein